VRRVRLSAVHVYPVKSLGGFAAEQRTVFRWGLDGDRRWMLIDETGANVTARTDHLMLSAHAQLGADSSLEVTAPGRARLVVLPPVGGTAVPVGLSRLDAAVPAGQAAHQWFTDLIGRPVRLVWLADPRAREVGSHHGGLPDDHMNLADAAPILLTTERSLGQLNDWLADTAVEVGEPLPDPLPMHRFRPNLVVSGAAEPFTEDRWRRVRIGDVVFRGSELCDRCVMTTIDVDTLRSSKEPIRTLARHRRWDGAVWFGARLIPTRAGTVRVGDPVVPEQ
jgi:MOSC domain-containing protein